VLISLELCILKLECGFGSYVYDLNSCISKSWRSAIAWCHRPICRSAFFQDSN